MNMHRNYSSILQYAHCRFVIKFVRKSKKSYRLLAITMVDRYLTGTNEEFLYFRKISQSFIVVALTPTSLAQI